MSVRPYSGSMVVKSDSMTCEPFAVETRRGPREIVRVEFRQYSGMASDGYTTGYQRRPVGWIEGESFGADGKLIRRGCWRFAGKRLGSIDAAYRKMIQVAVADVRPLTATFPIPQVA